eukprot:14192534-Heterocapsa_arctica.AAC.1
MDSAKCVHGELLRKLVGVPSFEPRLTHRPRPPIASKAVAPLHRLHARNARVRPQPLTSWFTTDFDHSCSRGCSDQAQVASEDCSWYPQD